MPYIPHGERVLQKKYALPPVTPGELNYAITRLVHDYLLQGHDVSEVKIRYADLNEVLGVLEAAKLEFYRTIVAPYEDKARAENGRISTLDTGNTCLT